MTYGVAIMYAVAAVLALVGAALLLKLRSPTISEAQTYAFRMTGIMAAAAGLVLALSATSLWSWSVEP